MAFAYRDGVLCAEDVSLEDIARRFGTPCYVYSRAAIERAYRRVRDALAGRPSLICYSVKANSNLAVLQLHGAAGRGLRHRLGRRARARARRRRRSRARVRVFRRRQDARPRSRRRSQAGDPLPQPGIRGRARARRRDRRRDWAGARRSRFASIPTSTRRRIPYISTGLKQNKFGIAYADAERLYREAARLPHLESVGIGCHIGSLTDRQRAVRRRRRARRRARRAPRARRHRALAHRPGRRHRHPLPGRDDRRRSRRSSHGALRRARRAARRR